MNFESLSEKSLRLEILNRDEMISVLHAPDERLPELLDAAFRVRRHYFGKRVQIHVLMNAKSGLCPEDCHYCSQSSVSTAPIDKYPLLPRERLLEGARRAKEAGAIRYCMVNSGRGPTLKEIEEMAEVVCRIKDSVPINICCSLGLLNEAKAKILKEAGVEIDPKLVKQSRAKAKEDGVSHLVEFRVQDAMKVDVSDATVVTLYLTSEFNSKLRPILKKQLRPGARVVSHDHETKGWTPDKIETMPGGLLHTHRIYLWRIKGGAANLSS